MAYGLIAAGTPISAFNVALVPVVPSAAVGSLLILQSQAYQGGFATPAVSGWTQISPGVNAKQVALWARIATGSDTPSINWGASANVFSSAWVNAYSGGPSTLTGIIHANSDLLANSTGSILYAALTVTQPGCLVICAGSRDKTSAVAAGKAFGPLTDGFFTIRNSLVLSGSNPGSVYNDWIQTTPTNFAAEAQFLGADATAQQCESITVALLPASAAPVMGGGRGLLLLGAG